MRRSRGRHSAASRFLRAPAEQTTWNDFSTSLPSKSCVVCNYIYMRICAADMRIGSALTPRPSPQATSPGRGVMPTAYLTHSKSIQVVCRAAASKTNILTSKTCTNSRSKSSARSASNKTIGICAAKTGKCFVVREGLSRLASGERVARKMKNIFRAIFNISHSFPRASQFRPYFMGVKCILRG